jgi:EXS family
MRQTHDNRRRWPYLGNAAKYFVAAQVVMFGVYHPEVKENPVWLLGFVLATLYQVCIVRHRF